VIAERWAEIEELFQRALECAPADRSRLLEEAGSSDPELRREVESLLSRQPSASENLRRAIQGAGPLDRAEFQGTERFVVQQRLGEGGFGAVYQVYDRQQDAVVALKALPEANAGAIYQFKREFRGLADTVHRNLVRLYELLSDNEQWFFTMELVDGADFIRYVRDDDSHDRLRAALRQLAEGVCALHQTGKLHRDLKPSNVLVTKEGRVVILDFGLATEIADDRRSGAEAIIGTPAYMSPEQAAARLLSEASDWYSVGVMLYQALTGRLPFDVHTRELLSRKLAADIAPPSTLTAGVPEDLNDLCCELLRRDADERPTGREVLRRLGGLEAAVSGETHALPSTSAEPFVGRQQELAELRRAFGVAQEGRAAIVHVRGGSGAGKSALAVHFLEELRIRDTAVVLAGRCYERESVPYKALDSLVDALAEHLKSLPQPLLETLVPDNVAALTRLFPGLERVESFAKAGRRDSDIAEPQELQQLAFTALRELLRRLAQRKPLVLFIDDCQWGDADSAALLAAVFRSPDPPPALWIACCRGEEAETSPLLRALVAAPPGPPSRVHLSQLALTELTPLEARELALRLLAEEDGAAGRAEAIAQEASGNPFFIHELARSAGGITSAVTTSLDNMIRSRVARLPEAARLLLELVSVAGQPIELEMVKRAAHIRGEEESVVGILRAGNLIRTRNREGRNEIEAYHDRTREAVGESLPPQIWKAHHSALAVELEASGRAETETLVTHFQGAGELAKAAAYAVAAGDRASAALAFDRAARLYRTALELGSGGAAQSTRLREKLADVLSNAGRGGEAAEAYLGAADDVTGAEKLELQRRAAAQFLVSGHIDQGLAVIRGVLHAVGMKLAPATWRAALSLLMGRARVRMRGLTFRDREASQVPAEELQRIDTCWSVAQGLGMVDTIHAADFQARHLLLALSAGEKYRIARALSVEAGYQALFGGRSRLRTERLLRSAAELSKACNHPHAVGLAALISGVAAFLEGRWKNARQLLEKGEALLLERCTGVVWELGTARLMHSVSLFFMGQFRELQSRVPALLEDAGRRGDLYAVTALGTRVGHCCGLAADEPEQAQSQVTQAIGRWSAQGFHIQHWWAMIAQVEIFLYKGESLKPWELLARLWPALRRSLLLRVQYIFIESLHHRAATALAVAANSAAGTFQAVRLLRSAERDAAQIERAKMPWGNGLALLVRAGVAAGRRDTEEASRLLNTAETSLHGADMELYAAAARRIRGELMGGDGGRILIAEADALMLRQQIRNPARMTAMLAPGISISPPA
jgi:hypothetical protein